MGVPQDLHDYEIKRSDQLSKAGAILGTGLIAVGGIMGYINGRFGEYPLAFDLTFVLFVSLLVPAVSFFLGSVGCVFLLYLAAERYESPIRRFSKESLPDSAEIDRRYLEAARDYAKVNDGREIWLARAAGSLTLSFVFATLLSVPFQIRHWCNLEETGEGVACFCKALGASHPKAPCPASWSGG